MRRPQCRLRLTTRRSQWPPRPRSQHRPRRTRARMPRRPQQRPHPPTAYPRRSRPAPMADRLGWAHPPTAHPRRSRPAPMADRLGWAHPPTAHPRRSRPAPMADRLGRLRLTPDPRRRRQPRNPAGSLHTTPSWRHHMAARLGQRTRPPCPATMAATGPCRLRRPMPLRPPRRQRPPIVDSMADRRHTRAPTHLRMLLIRVHCRGGHLRLCGRPCPPPQYGRWSTPRPPWSPLPPRPWLRRL
jgi:hypothetical protein